MQFTPGSSTGFNARTVDPKLAEIWNQPVVYENRSGAGGGLANAMAAKATPDGYKRSMVSSAVVANTVLNVKSRYDPVKEFVAVAQAGYLRRASSRGHVKSNSRAASPGHVPVQIDQ